MVQNHSHEQPAQRNGPRLNAILGRIESENMTILLSHFAHLYYTKFCRLSTTYGCDFFAMPNQFPISSKSGIVSPARGMPTPVLLRHTIVSNFIFLRLTPSLYCARLALLATTTFCKEKHIMSESQAPQVMTQDVTESKDEEGNPVFAVRIKVYRLSDYNRQEPLQLVVHVSHRDESEHQRIAQAYSVLTARVRHLLHRLEQMEALHPPPDQ